MAATQTKISNNALATLTSVYSTQTAAPGTNATALVEEATARAANPVKLRDWAERSGTRIGALLNWLFLSNPAYQEFNQTIINVLRGTSMPKRGEFDFQQVDKVVAAISSYDLTAVGLHLVWDWPGIQPLWLRDGNFTTDELMVIMVEIAQAIATHLQGVVTTWSVVNEPVFQDWQQRTTQGDGTFWHARFGSLDYMDAVFRTARAADPGAVLLWNEYNNTVINEVSDRQYQHVQLMLDRGVPIDAIGIQAHTNAASPPTRDSMAANFGRFAELGLSLHLTELDVNIKHLLGSDEEKREIQARIYRDIVGTALDSGCRDINIFGVTDSDWHYEGAETRAYLFDAQNQPKPAYFAVLEELQRIVTVN